MRSEPLSVLISFGSRNPYKLLRSLRDLNRNGATNRVGVPQVDCILDIFTHQPQRLQESRQEWTIPSPVQDNMTRRPSKAPVIEICGANPCSGKTQLLYYIAATALLPSTYDYAQFVANGQAVIWIDTDSRFDILQFRTVLRYNLLKHENNAALPSPDLESLVTGCLQHLHIFRPQSSAALLATIRSIQDYLFSLTRHYSGARPLQAIILSNISAFIHQDRLESDEDLLGESALPGSGTATQRSSTLYIQRYRDITSALREVQAIFSCTILAGNIALSPLQPSSLGPFLRPHLPPAWNAFCAAKIIVVRERTPKFPPSISSEEAALEASMRRNAVIKSGFRGWVDSWGAEDWEASTKEMLKNIGDFKFAIDENGVRFIENGEHEDDQ